MHNVSFKCLVLPHQRRTDGTYNIKLRVTFRRRSRYLPTTLNAQPGQLSRSFNIKDGVLAAACDRVIAQARETVAQRGPLVLLDDALTVDGIVSWLRQAQGSSWRLEFTGYARTFIDGKRPGTRRAYRTALEAWTEYMGGEHDINSITRTDVLKFAAWVNAGRGTGKAQSVGALYVSRLGAIFRDAKHRYNDGDEPLIPRDPFTVTLPRVFHNGQKNIGVEVIQAMIDDATEEPAVRFALDVSLLSFCLMAPNIADLYAAAAPSGGWWRYNRQKTKERRADAALMRVRVPAISAPFAGRLRDKRGTRWLDLYTRGSKDYITRLVNAGLRTWAESAGVEPFTFYAMRHSWASIARSCGVDKATIDEALGHVGEFRIADIYAERDWEIIASANDKVLARFRWPEKKVE